MHLRYGCGIPLYLYQSGYVRNLELLFLLRRVVATVRFSECYATDTMHYIYIMYILTKIEISKTQ